MTNNPKSMDDPKRVYTFDVRHFDVRRNEKYNAFPDLALTDAGRLICAWRPADHHKPDAESGLMVAFSDDRGETWSAPQTLGWSDNLKDRMWNCPSLRVLSDGKIVLLVDCSAHGDQLENARPPHDILMFTSEDNGESWTGPKSIAPVGMCPDKLQVLPSGRWLIAAHQWRTTDRPRIVQNAWTSDDAGNTWAGPFEIGSHPDYHLCEASIVQHPSGPLVAYMRENSYLGVGMFKSISRDEGKTWELMETNILGGHRPRCGFLRNGKMMTLYRFNLSSRVKESCLCAFIEPADSVLEENRLAQRGRMIPLVQDFHDDPDMGYTGWVEFPDSEVVIVSYMRGSNHTGYIFGFGVSPERMEMLSSST